MDILKNNMLFSPLEQFNTGVYYFSISFNKVLYLWDWMIVNYSSVEHLPYKSNFFCVEEFVDYIDWKLGIGYSFHDYYLYLKIFYRRTTMLEFSPDNKEYDNFMNGYELPYTHIYSKRGDKFFSIFEPYNPYTLDANIGLLSKWKDSLIEWPHHFISELESDNFLYTKPYGFGTFDDSIFGHFLGESNYIGGFLNHMKNEFTYINFLFDLTFFDIMVGVLFVVIFFWVLYSLLIFRKRSSLKLIPYKNFLQYIIEVKFIFIFNLIKQQIGPKGYLYSIFSLYIFSLIFYLNFIALLPTSFSLTSQLILMLFFSLTLCIGIFINGILNNNVNFFKVFIPQSPLLMLPLLIIIEIFSYIIRMFSLAIRLSANIMAGHTLIHIVATFAGTLVFVGGPMMHISGALLICVIMILEFCVAFLQAYVFLILILIYLNDVYNINH